MRPLGPAGAPFLVADAGSGVKLRAGVSVSITVLDRLSPGLYTVLAGGQVLRARTDAVLSPGSVLLARVERNEGGPGLLFRLVPGQGGSAGPDRGLDAVIAQLGLRPDAAGRLAASALLAEVQTVTAAALVRVRKAALGGKAGDEGPAGDEGGEMEERARLAARMEAKGLGATAEAVDLLVELSGGGSGSGGSGEEGARGGNAGRQGDANVPSGAPGSAPPAEPPAAMELSGADWEKALARFLARLCFASADALPDAAASRATQGLSPSSAFLGLFNHTRAEHDDWITVPFRFSLDLVEFAGSFHILLPYMPGGPGRIEASFTSLARGANENGRTSSTGPRRWKFGLSFGEGRPRLVLRGCESAGARRSLAELRRGLEAAGCELALAAGEDAAGPREVDLHA